MVLVAVGLSGPPIAANGPSTDGFDYHLPKPVDADQLAHLFDARAIHTDGARRAGRSNQ